MRPAYLEFPPTQQGCEKTLMSSIWKDLLFLHGYLQARDELSWRADAQPEKALPTAAATPPPKPAPAGNPPPRTKPACA
jgi:hypothetical protein